MSYESKTLTTADLANAGKQAPLEPTSDRPPAGPVLEVRESQPIRNPGAAEERAGVTEEQTGPQNQPVERPGSNDAGTIPEPLFEQKEAEGLRNRWNEIQVGFVDEPRAAVEKADGLVADTIKRLADSFATSRTELESAWDREGNVSTEGLRLALQRYRSFFNRLLSI
ncbi:MAG TPA: hypothetical protein VGZ29_16085 [Terriglobia bacterium]|nr:hypothetical protein [Terriglobia bacterium]